MTESLTTRVLKGSLISFSIKFIQKSLGLISTLILARLLTPEDFGIVAIAALVLHFCDVLSTAGSESYLIQKAHLDKYDINSSWTLELILKSSLFILFVLAVPFIATFYGNPELEAVLYVSSTVLLFNALKSPGIALLKKELEYRKIFLLNVIQKLVVFSFILVWVFVEPSFWALIVGDVVSAAVLAAGSYLIHSHRPKLCLKKIKEQLSFSKWIILKSGVGYSKAQLDVFFVAKYFSAELVGVYHLARQIALLPSTDIVAPAIEPLMSSFSKVKADKERFNNQFNMSFLVVNIAIIPAAIFILYFPDLIVETLLGPQWQQAHSILSALTILLVAFMINQLLAPFCVALGKVKTIFYYDLFSFIFIFAGLFLFSSLNLYNFALLRGLLAWVPLLVMLFYICRTSGISFNKLIFNMIILLLSSLIAIECADSIISIINTNVFISLIIGGLAFYSILLLVLLAASRFLLSSEETWSRLDALVVVFVNNLWIKIRY